MAGGSLGTVYGTIRMEVASALAAFAAVNRANAAAVGALRSSSAAVVAASRGFTTAGLVMAAGIGYAVNAAADFEKKLDFFGAVSNSTQEEMDAVRKKALELGQDTRYSAQQIADSFVELGKAGVSAKDIVDGVADAVVALGAAGDIKLDKAAQIITSAIQTFELGAGDSMHVADLLAGAANASIVDIDDLGVSLKYVGGVAHSISVPIEDVIDTLGILGKAGIRGSTAGTSLRQILVSLSGTSKKAQNTLRDLGIITDEGGNKFFTAEGKAKSLAEIFQILQDHTAGLTEEQRLSAFKIIFNNRALAAANILANGGADAFARMNAEVTKVKAADVAAKRLDNLNGDLLKLRGSLETLFIQAGGPFQETLRTWVQGLTNLVQAFNNLDPSTQKTIFQIILWTGTALLAIGVVLKLVAGVLRLWALFLKLGPAITFLAKVVVILSRGLWQLGVVLLTTPIGWIILLIAALVIAFILLWNKCEGFREFWKDLGKTLVEVGKAILDWFKGLPKFFSDLWDDIVNFFQAGYNKTKDIWNKFTGLLGTGWDATIAALKASGKALADFFIELPGHILDGLQAAGEAILQFLKDLPYNIGFAIGFILGSLIRFGAEAATWAWNAGVEITKNLLTFFIELPGNLWDIFVKVTTSLIKWGAEASTWAWDVGLKITETLLDFFVDLPGNIWDLLVDITKKLGDWELEAVQKAKDIGESVFNGVVDWIKKLPEEVWNALKTAGSTLASSILSFGLWAAQIGMSVFNAVKDWLGKLPGLAWEAIKNTIQAFKDMVQAAWNAAKDFAEGLWDGFKKGLGINSPSLIEKQMFQIREVMETETASIKRNVRTLQGLGRGVAGMNPVISRDNVDALNLSAQAMAEQLAALKSTQAALSSARIGASIGFDDDEAITSAVRGRGPDDPGAAMTVVMNVFNPQAEPASSTAARKLRTLSDMGAFK